MGENIEIKEKKAGTNRIEAKLAELKNENKKALITYLTAGLPTLEKTIELIKAQEEAGVDIIEIGIPFSDPIADGPVIQDASFRSILNGTNLKKSFDAIETARKSVNVPIVFMMYYNTISYYGLDAFAEKCAAVGIDGLIVPDLPYEEQGYLLAALAKVVNAPILIQLVAPVSKQRIPMILENARGFVYCVSQMGVTGNGAGFHKDIQEYLANVKSISKIPVMMGFGIKTAADVIPLKEVIDGAIVGSAFIKLLDEHNFDAEVAKEYIRTFKKEFNK